MLQITPQIKIYLYRDPVDMRKGIDGLCSVCRRFLNKEPFSGSMFIFRNKRGSTLKILFYDGQGYWLFMKRLSKGRFNWWPDRESDVVMMLSAAQLHLLIWNGDVSLCGIGSDWRRIRE